jgi:hypothetical protein
MTNGVSGLTLDSLDSTLRFQCNKIGARKTIAKNAQKVPNIAKIGIRTTQSCSC